MNWFHSGSNLKTEAKVNRLVKEIRDGGGLPGSDLDGFDVHRENSRLDAAQKSQLFGDNFQETTLDIPTNGYSLNSDSDAFIAAHDDIQRHGLLPPDDLGCVRKKIIAALMFWSDSTHLTDFGTAKIWPIYLVFGNLSKYIRGRPTSGAWYHLAYIPSVCPFL